MCEIDHRGAGVAADRTEDLAAAKTKGREL